MSEQKTAAAHNAQFTGVAILSNTSGGPSITATHWPPMNHVGTCGACGGRVMQSALVATPYPPIQPPRRCEQCGRTAKEPSLTLPVLEMYPDAHQR